MDDKLDPASPYLLKNSSGLPALGGGSGCHVFDHTKAKVRDYWTQMCLNPKRYEEWLGRRMRSGRLYAERTQLAPQPSDGCCVADRARNDDAADHHSAGPTWGSSRQTAVGGRRLRQWGAA
jgi:hypothetical protein